jgi:3-oxoacyl-[acyl-carrier-protein] synthase II
MIADTRLPRRRVVVTGMGILSPLGGSVEEFWSALRAGRSGIRRIESFEIDEYPVTIGGEVDRSQINGDLSDKFVSRTDRSLVLALSAAGRALGDAGFPIDGQEPVDAACVIGSGLGPSQTAESGYSTLALQGWQALRPTTIPKIMYNVTASRVSIHYRLVGEHHAVASACASSASALCHAMLLIRSGVENVVLSGGADCPFTPGMFGAWVNLRVLSRNPDAPHACRPFDRERDGLVLAEGAAMLVLEELEHAVRRGAPIYAELIGYGASSDASHVTNPDPEGQTRALTRALRDAHIEPDEIDYINAHGTATLINDPVETEATKRALGAHAYRVPMSSTKSMTGHTLGSAGAMELIASIQAIRDGFVPPTINLDDPDPACDLDYVPRKGRARPVRTVLSNSFAFGGSNCVLVAREFAP